MNVEEQVSPDVIQLVVRHEEELIATYADLHVRVRGSSLVLGTAALTKAREVATMVAALEAIGVKAADIAVENVQAEVASGLLTRTSSALYALRVRCRDLGALPDALGAVTSQKNNELTGIEWGYPDDQARRTGWLTTCARQANERARELAQALGVRLLGVHRFAEPEVLELVVRPGAGGSPRGTAFAQALRPRSGAAELGLSISNTRRVEIRVLVEYRISGFEP